MKHIAWMSGLACMASLIALPCLAQDGLDARTHAKVMRAKRQQAMAQNVNQDGRAGLPPVGAGQAQIADPCKAGIDIGNVYVDRNNRGGAPRENTVVVTGDVIFAPSRNCR